MAFIALDSPFGTHITSLLQLRQIPYIFISCSVIPYLRYSCTGFSGSNRDFIGAVTFGIQDPGSTTVTSPHNVRGEQFSCSTDFITNYLISIWMEASQFRFSIIHFLQQIYSYTRYRCSFSPKWACYESSTVRAATDETTSATHEGEVEIDWCQISDINTHLWLWLMCVWSDGDHTRCVHVQLLSLSCECNKSSPDTGSCYNVRVSKFSVNIDVLTDVISMEWTNEWFMDRQSGI